MSKCRFREKLSEDDKNLNKAKIPTGLYARVIEDMMSAHSFRVEDFLGCEGLMGQSATLFVLQFTSAYINSPGYALNSCFKICLCTLKGQYTRP